MQKIGKIRPSVVVLVALLIFGITLIFKYPSIPVFDQFFVKYRFDSGGFPLFADGLGLWYLAGLYNLIRQPPAELLNPEFKTIALLSYMVSGYFLARKVLKTEIFIILFSVLLFSSRLPFLWLSSELLCGTFLMLAVLSIISEWRPIVVGIVLAVLALLKPDMPLIALVLLLYYCFKVAKPKQWLKVCATFAFITIACVIPSLLVTPGQSLSRSFLAFAQHYTFVFRIHQVNHEYYNSWDDWPTFMKGIFPGANSMGEVILNYPRKYLDAVVLMVVKSAINFAKLHNFLLIIVGVRLWLWLKHRVVFSSFERLTLLTFIGLIPIVAFAYLHIRYQARYYPLVVILCLGFVQRLRSEGLSIKNQAWFSGGVWLALLFNLSTQLYLFTRDVTSLQNRPYWWFPD